ncbi:ATP-grasp peptide maturase system methyltransferase [Prauserella sp. ASG 168]|uniref:Protein-L-isoaspartate O-methyltransferase n=2 Tax=Prauserella cavernicola TaxID=2800127 RepID=A0A934V5B9_9PSEU|nr:ATP-grasp peptide maturase system methyltransferase [Prauserella cavernicola]
MWREHARKLGERVAADGVLTDPMWRAALEGVPRHVFVPHFFEQRRDGSWAKKGVGDAGWLETVYSDRPLVTALARTESGNSVTVSSSTKPGLMVRMLEALELRDGHRVLEIGTGTGYNAGLLAHRLGDACVFSVDIGAGLVDAARERLADLGYAPTLAATDGTAGLPDAAPFDRIIATCSVPAVPWTWARQVRDGGLVLVDVKRGSHAGNLVRLRRIGDRLEGRFSPRWAGFMAMRATDTAPSSEQARKIDLDNGLRSTTTLDAEPWTNALPWFLAQSQLPRRVVFGYRGRNGAQWATFTGDDGSWCAIALDSDERGAREVRYGGPVRIWEQFERVHTMWDTLGRPGWDRFGLTVTPDGFHQMWLDEPDGPFRWSLPPLP